MILSPETVSKIVKGWSIIFPGNKPPEELAFITAKFYQALRSTYNDENFKRAAELAERETEFFPTIKLLLSLREAAYQVADGQIAMGDVLLLKEETELTSEEIEINKQKIKIITEMLAGKYTISEAIEAQEKIKFYTV